eukprot:scaffold143_cov110-Isochrysis_galbana.AAC.4
MASRHHLRALWQRGAIPYLQQVAISSPTGRKVSVTLRHQATSSHIRYHQTLWSIQVKGPTYLRQVRCSVRVYWYWGLGTRPS